MKALTFLGNFIAGRFLRPARGRWLTSEDPGDLDNPVGRVRLDPAAAGAAAAAAARAFPAWRALPMARRIKFLRRYQAALSRRREELAWTISRETGKPLSESAAEARTMVEKVDVTIREALPLVADRVFPLGGGARGAVRYRPRGPAAVIGPFNVPGHLPNGQIVPALLTGNTVVFKPSELTPFTGQRLAECFRAAGLPPGVFNLVQGDGAAGARLAEDPRVKTVLFTGSFATGERLKAAAAGAPEKLVALEMGGKNAALVLADAPLDSALREILHGAFSTAGQRCSSTSRVFLHRAVAARFLKKFVPAAAALRAGYFTEDVFMGPLVSAAAKDRFLAAQRAARRMGFRPLLEGRSLAAPRRGHYVGPAVNVWEKDWRRLPASRTYWDEELFAPDAAVYVMSSEDDMVRANNDSRYGLAASIFTRSEKAFRRLAPRLENGVVHWNRTTAMTPGRLPFGGLKRSGNARPAGLFVPYACTDPVASVEVRAAG